jgi:hypothetical protein
MSTLRRRLDRLEGDRLHPSPWDVMDPILAAMSTPDLIALLHHDRAVREGRRPTLAEAAVYATVRDRIVALGIPLP